MELNIQELSGEQLNTLLKWHIITIDEMIVGVINKNRLHNFSVEQWAILQKILNK
jgi:hypothetical protein